MAYVLAAGRGAESPRAGLHRVVQQPGYGLRFGGGGGAFIGLRAQHIGAQRGNGNHERQVHRTAAFCGCVDVLREGFPVPAYACSQYLVIDTFHGNQIFGQ